MAFFDERDELKNCSENLTLGKECIPGITAKAKLLREKLAEQERVETAAKCTLEIHRKNYATDVDRLLVLLKVELVQATVLDTPLLKIASRSGASAKNTETKL